MMSYIFDYGLDSPSRGLLILVLSLFDRNNNKKMDIVHIQKIIRYFEYLRKKREIDFSNFKMGGVSYELRENIDTLQESGLVEQLDKVNYILTDDGEKAAEEIKNIYDEKELQHLSYSKYLLNDLSRDELLFYMYMILPATQKYSTEFEDLYKKRWKLTTNIFLKGRINSNMASKWLGVDEKRFLNSLPLKR